MSKFSDFLGKEKIDPRRVLSASKALEALKVEDRALRMKKTQLKAGGKELTDEDKALLAKKGRSGRPVSAPELRAAASGKDIPGAAKTRILRAVNQVLKTKKKSEVVLKDLF